MIEDSKSGPHTWDVTGVFGEALDVGEGDFYTPL